MKSPAAAEYMKQLGFSEGYELLYAIAVSYTHLDVYKRQNLHPLRSLAP